MNRWLLFLLLAPCLLHAQGKQQTPRRWKGIVSAGLLAGSTLRPQWQASGGLLFDKWFAGLGMAYDRYAYQSFPVFADGRIDFGKRRLVFLYAMPGVNIPGKFSRELNGNSGSFDRMRAGYYLDAGLGLRIKLTTNNRLAFSTGLSHKTAARVRKLYWPCNGGNGPCDDERPEVFSYRYRYGRIVTRLSWEFGMLR